MDPSFAVASALLAFAVTHIGLATGPLRDPLVRRLGRWGFVLVFFAVASVTFATAIATYAAHRYTGAPGLALGETPALGFLLSALAVAAFALIGGSLIVYPRSPMALGNERVPEPRGLERVSRHPFFAAVALLGLAHALLAPRLPGAILMGGLGLFAVVGGLHQDRKLRRLRGVAYAEYLEATSFVPFAAIVRGRQRLALGELPWVGMGVGVALGLALREVHASIFAWGGTPVIATVVGGASLLALATWRRERQRVAASAAEEAGWTA